ncbi:MAG: 2-phosphosulfolactate phosphatase [Actinomycetota bacterium]|nr:2-phosphosulfolactate phosphatase [Actinomycetota bacterium]
MRIEIVTPEACDDVDGAAVVVDVLRAFTTAAYAFERGAREIVLVRTLEEARSVRDRLDAVTMGEEHGEPVEDFALGNSPDEVRDLRLGGVVLVQRTTTGTQAVVNCAQADPLLAASFVCVQATVRFLAGRRPETVKLVVTGAHSGRDGDEDYACAEYLAARLRDQEPDVRPYLDRVRNSDAGRLFASGAEVDHRPEDLELALDVDRFPRALAVSRQHDLVVLRPVAAA